MSWIDRLLGRKSARTLDQLPGWWMGQESKSGVAVNFSTALQVAAVMACVKVIAKGIAMSPAKLMKDRAGRKGADVATDHPLYWILYRQPFGRQTAFEFWETIVVHLLLAGNAFVYINRVGGRIHELVILEPGCVRVTRHADLTLTYTVTSREGAGERGFTAEEIWHVRGMSWCGWIGMDTVRLAREAIGLAMALEESHAGLHKNGAKPSGVYSVEGNLTTEQHAQVTEWLKKNAATPGAPLILDRAAKWFQTQMSGVDTQHLETRRFQIEEICRVFEVMPVMVGLSDKTATYASVEQMLLAHEMHTITPVAVRLEQSVDVSLLTEAEQKAGYHLKFNLSAFRRADYKTRQEGLQIQRRNGIINADEWRDLEDMNPREDEGGQQYIVEGNMAVQDGRDLVPIKTVIA